MGNAFLDGVIMRDMPEVWVQSRGLTTYMDITPEDGPFYFLQTQ